MGSKSPIVTKSLLSFSFDDIIDHPLTFLSNLVDSRHSVITLTVLLKSTALLASDVVKFTPKSTRSGQEQSLTLIGYSSALPEIDESSPIKKG